MSEKDHPARVADCVAAALAAIAEARAAGYRVDGDNGLAGISVSETAKLNAPPAPGQEYEAMSKSALLELAAARGLEIASNSTKAEIIAALRS